MQSAALQVLIVADSPEDRLALRRLLTQDTPAAYTIAEASRGDHALAACQEAAPDCLLLDFRPPDLDGLAALAASRAEHGLPVVLLTGAGDEALALEGLQRGAQDYLVKGTLTPERLRLTIQHAVNTARLTRERSQALALLGAVLDRLPVGVALLDADLRVHRANPALASILGTPTPALPGQTLAQLWPELAQALAAPCAQVLRGEGFGDLELQLTAGQGERWLVCSGSPARASDGTGPLALLTVQDRTACRQAAAAQCASEIRTEAGEAVWVSVSGVPVDFPDWRVVLVTSDITERKQADDALRAATAQVATYARSAAEHAARLDSLLAHAPVGVSLLDTQLRFQHINAYLAAINGLPVEAHLGRPIGELLPALGPELEAIYRQVLATGEPLLDVEVHGETPAAPGVSRVWRASYFPVRAASGPLLGVGAVLVEITAQRQAEQARQVAYRQLETILQNLDEGVVAVKPDGTFVMINPAARRQMLPGAAALPGTLAELEAAAVKIYDQAGELIPAHDHPLKRALRGERFQNLEVKLCVAGEPEDRWMVLSGAPVYAADGALVLAIVTGADVTRRKRDEAALAAHAETLSKTNAELNRALRLKDAFTAMMSHELRTPLNTILGFTEGMAEGLFGPLSAQQREALSKVLNSGRQLLAILSDILDLVHIEAGNGALDLQPIEVDNLCRIALRFVQDAARQKQIRLLRTVAAEVEGLRADEHRLVQILVNLLDNAVKFTPVGGTVGLEITADAAQESIQLVVWDTGIGIAEADYAQLFQPFTQVDGRLARQYGGIGLGLTLVRRLVDLHGGSVSLESAPGQGSRFTVSLPWAAADNVVAAGDRPLLAQLSAWARPPRVVIADDHELTLKFYRELLAEQGCVVTIARTGAEALSQVRATRPDLAILDIQMPELDGLTVIRQLRADPAFAGLPIIALTALAMPGDAERALAAGATRYLVKPMNLRTLLAAMEELLRPQDPPVEN